MLEKTLGEHIMIEALSHSSFFIALMVSSRSTFLQPYSRRAQTVIITLGSLGWYAFFLATNLLAAMT